MLHLYDAKGALLTSVRSTGDGYYIFTGVRPGKYSIGVSPELIQRLRLEPVEKESVDITADGGPVNGIDFVLRTAEPEAAGGKAAPAPRKSP
jgi:hypothetical protein